MMGNVSVPGGKGTVTELGSHVPLIASWRGKILEARTNASLINFCDFLPTLTELTDAKLPNGVKIDGQSFASQLMGKDMKGREWVFTQLGQRKFARDQRYLLHNDGRIFDISNDLFERNDLSRSDKPEFVAAKKRLQLALDQNK